MRERHVCSSAVQEKVSRAVKKGKTKNRGQLGSISAKRRALETPTRPKSFLRTMLLTPHPPFLQRCPPTFLRNSLVSSFLASLSLYTSSGANSLRPSFPSRILMRSFISRKPRPTGLESGVNGIPRSPRLQDSICSPMHSAR